jgi:hypothetical protein
MHGWKFLATMVAKKLQITSEINLNAIKSYFKTGGRGGREIFRYHRISVILLPELWIRRLQIWQKAKGERHLSQGFM